MSTILTEEQKKRIEANKQRALEIRAKKLENSSSSPVDKQVHNSPQFNSKPITQNISQTNSPSVTVSSQNGSQFYSRPVDNSKANYYINKFKKTSLSSATGKQEIVTGTCVLTAPDRFTVVVGYCQALISAFQSIEGRIYDAKTKNWSFPLSQYKTLLNKVSDIRDMVTLGPIPSPVLRLFNDRVSKNLAGSDLSRLTPSLLTSLYPFQKIGIQFGISKNCRCILADDMGLGKTIQALGLCDYYRDDWPLLIMCPASMRFQWDEEIRTHLPYVPESGIYVINSSKDEFLNPKVVITSYDLMSKISKQLKSIRFNIVIADESHFLKSTKANRTRVGVDLIKSARRCILLSGTPALSRPIELYSQINAIDPKFFPNMTDFGIRYCGGVKNHFGWDFSGSTNMEELKLVMEEKFMIRRLKSEVLTQLPAKIRQVISIEHAMDTSDKKMKALIKKLDSEKVVGMERRGALLAYYHETGITKINAINDYITSLLEQNKKFLVFAHHQVVLDAVSKLLEDKKTFYIRIDGSVGSEERKSVVDQFQYEEKFRVAVLSITAANSGITLTAANLVVFAELFWNPGILTQAEDRAHRIGQQDSVLIQYLVAKNTADDYLWPLVMTKLDVLNRAGLSKDNFSAADTTAHNFKDPSQKSIANYFLDLDDETEVLFNSVMDDFESEIPEKKLKLST
uniref:SWI/SNF-related matrix-associated actin-dependent regulator of chromatin subfamily A-like protein 1 n=1 Tax=Cacopsylla melanoneura TaxID=428564 RepID=A0A8D8YLQ4_9HEMI